MALASGAAVFQYGTQATVINDTSAIAAGAFNADTPTALVQTDFTPLGDAVLQIQMAVAPAAGDAVHLYRRDMNIDGANSATVPDATFKNTYVGSFPLDLVTTAQYVPLTDIPLVVDQEFYIELDSLQATNVATATVVKVTPKSYNAKA